jgi:CDP-glycerol glycerophosphotransferase (TagB/SpsB family)
LFNDPEPLYLNAGKTKLKMIKHQLQTRLETRRRKQFLDTNSITSIKDEKFLYFPLASEPEARILTTSPFYTNQITLAENIAKSISIDFVLYVKEHPIQELKAWRSIDEYEKIISMPNVRLVHPSVKNQDLISKSQGVIAISGGTAFEAIFYKKPVILFADEYYDVLSMVTKIKTLPTLPNDIANALSNFKFNNDELAAFMQAFNKHSLSVPYHSIMNEGDILSAIQRYGHDFNLTTKEFHKFYEKFKNHFELIAQRIYSTL